jgi:hypothetical protein
MASETSLLRCDFYKGIFFSMRQCERQEDRQYPQHAVVSFGKQLVAARPSTDKRSGCQESLAQPIATRLSLRETRYLKKLFLFCLFCGYLNRCKMQISP